MVTLPKESLVHPSTELSEPEISDEFQGKSCTNSGRIQQTELEADGQSALQRAQSSAQALPGSAVDRPDEEGNYAQESKHQVGSNSMSKTTELLASSDNGAAHPQVDQQQNPPGIVQNLSKAIPASAGEEQPPKYHVVEGIPSHSGTQVNGDQHYYGSGMRPTQQTRSSETHKEAEKSKSRTRDQSILQLIWILPRWLKVIVSVILLLSWAAILILGTMYGTDRNSWNSTRKVWALEEQQLTDQINQQETWWEEKNNAWKRRSEKQEEAWKTKYEKADEAWKDRWQDGESAHEKIINEWLAREKQWNIERSLLMSRKPGP